MAVDTFFQGEGFRFLQTLRMTRIKLVKYSFENF